jgi:hypothetical protein
MTSRSCPSGKCGGKADLPWEVVPVFPSTRTKSSGDGTRRRVIQFQEIIKDIYPNVRLYHGVSLNLDSDVGESHNLG